MSAPNDNAAPYVDDRELARRTPLSRANWQIMRVRGTGPNYMKDGRRCLYKWSEVVTWLETHRTMTKVG